MYVGMLYRCLLGLKHPCCVLATRGSSLQRAKASSSSNILVDGCCRTVGTLVRSSRQQGPGQVPRGIYIYISC